MFCYQWDLFGETAAAWVQAIGSIAAIFIALLIASKQSRDQLRNERRLQRESDHNKELSLVRTVLKIAVNSKKLVAHCATTLQNRERLAYAAEGSIPFDRDGLRYMEYSLESIPLYQLQDDLVTPVMLLASTVRQFREKVEIGLRIHSRLNAQQHDDLFKTFSEMVEALDSIANDLSKQVEKMASVGLRE